MICPEFVAYFKTGYTGGLRGQGPQRHRVEVTFPIELWNVSYGHVTKCQEQTIV